MTTLWQGKCSTFGGPEDMGVSSREGLALYDHDDIDKRPDLFLPEQPLHTTGVARRLNPDAFYLACRWNYHQTSRDFLRTHVVTVTNVRTGKSCTSVNPTDWGPNHDTGRVADLSPGLAKFLDLQTDDVVRIDVDLP